MLEADCFGAEGQPILANTGAYAVRRQYDQWGNEVEFALFGLSNEPVADLDGVSRTVSAVDKHGNQVSVRHYGLDGALVDVRDGAVREIKVDAHGRQAEVKRTKRDGTLMRDGWQQFKYDSEGRLLQMIFLDVNGSYLSNGVTSRWLEYDGRGNLAPHAISMWRASS